MRLASGPGLSEPRPALPAAVLQPHTKTLRLHVFFTFFLVFSSSPHHVVHHLGVVHVQHPARQGAPPVGHDAVVRRHVVGHVCVWGGRVVFGCVWVVCGGVWVWGWGWGGAGVGGQSTSGAADGKQAAGSEAGNKRHMRIGGLVHRAWPESPHREDGRPNTGARAAAAAALTGQVEAPGDGLGAERLLEGGEGGVGGVAHRVQHAGARHHQGDVPDVPRVAQVLWREGGARGARVGQGGRGWAGQQRGWDASYIMHSLRRSCSHVRQRWRAPAQHPHASCGGAACARHLAASTRQLARRTHLIHQPGGVERLGRHEGAHAVLVPAGGGSGSVGGGRTTRQVLAFAFTRRQWYQRPRRGGAGAAQGEVPEGMPAGAACSTPLAMSAATCRHKTTSSKGKVLTSCGAPPAERLSPHPSRLHGRKRAGGRGSGAGFCRRTPMHSSPGAFKRSGSGKEGSKQGPATMPPCSPYTAVRQAIGGTEAAHGPGSATAAQAMQGSAGVHGASRRCRGPALDSQKRREEEGRGEERRGEERRDSPMSSSSSVTTGLSRVCSPAPHTSGWLRRGQAGTGERRAQARQRAASRPARGCVQAGAAGMHWGAAGGGVGRAAHKTGPGGGGLTAACSGGSWPRLGPWPCQVPHS